MTQETPPSAAQKTVGVSRRIWSLASSVAAFVADHGRTVSKEQYAARLSICDSCECRDGCRCSVCGCYLAIKAKGRAMQCPRDQWPPA